MVMKIRITILIYSMCIGFSYAQSNKNSDTLHAKKTDSVTVESYIYSLSKTGLPDIQGTYMNTGKKSENINLLETGADIANKVGRQVFSKVPGVFVYDMDGSGNQINIATRGLDPHRGWEFNIRKDGILTNSDMYGYPASHYSMPLESIDHIEMVRGTGSLQYGAQFGGMLNYINKKADTVKPFTVESVNSIGSYHLLSSYLAIGARTGKFSVYAYVSRKLRDGYRVNEHTKSEAEAVILNYEPTSRLSLRLEWARSGYVYRMPGPLTDMQFLSDPKQASRSRNYFNPDIHIPSISLNWQFSSRTRISISTSAVLGNRNSVLFDKPANISDTINQLTGQYNNRQVDIDRFNSYTSEIRLLQDYSTGKQMSTIVAGVQYMNNKLYRTQLGVGSTGNDYDIGLVSPGWGRDLQFATKNIAVFAENKFQVNKQLSFTVGARIENGHTQLSGTINYYPENKIPMYISHNFPLYEAGFLYKLKDNLQFYGGWAQAYRPMIFKDLIPGSVYEKVDPNIRDASGYNAEIGFKGSRKYVNWDISAFVLRDNNRFGTLAQPDVNGTLYLYRTNIGNSLSKGLEMYFQANWIVSKKTSYSFFTATSLMQARYTEAFVKSGNTNKDIRGNKVESAPDIISRNGLTFKQNKLQISLLYSYTASTYADALNTESPPVSTGAVGLVPAYGIWDMNVSMKFLKKLECKINISNLLDKHYFTKRPMFYPGPGIWPSDGRNFTCSLGLKL